MTETDSKSDSSSTKSFTNVISFGESLVSTPEIKQSSIVETTLDGLLETPLKFKEDLKEGCGGQLWPAGMVLARYMLTYHRDTLVHRTMYESFRPHGRKILTQMADRLELGAGSGLVGLVVARGCRTTNQVHITDQKPMLTLMQENVQLNSLSDQVSVSVYDWGAGIPTKLASAFTQGGCKPNVILAADCVYFEPAFPLLKDTLIDLIGEETVCYFCFKKRRKADWRFVRMISKVLDVREISDDVNRNLYSKDGIFLFKITKKT